MAGSIEILDTLRHECHRCGAMCQGKVVHLHASEVEQVRGQAADLGLADPVEDDRLRQDGGRCVFLGQDNLCRIHGLWGAEAKPKVCQQAPLVALRTESEVRVAVEPGCLHTWRSWRDGPELTPGALVLTAVPLDRRMLPLEEAVVDLLGPGATVASALASLAGRQAPPAGGLHDGFAERLCTRLRVLGLRERLSHPETSPALRAALDPLAALLPTLDVPRPWPVLNPEADAFAVEVARRTVYLRLVTGLPYPPAAALLVLCGAVACAWATPTMERFGPALSAWSRLVRNPANVGALLPTAASLESLLRG